MKKIFNKFIPALSLSLIGGSAIASNAILKTPNYINIDTNSTTPANVLLKIRKGTSDGRIVMLSNKFSGSSIINSRIPKVTSTTTILQNQK